jgi:hypothetical protein
MAGFRLVREHGSAQHPEIQWTLEGQVVVAREFERESAEMIQKVADDASTLSARRRLVKSVAAAGDLCARGR